MNRRLIGKDPDAGKDWRQKEKRASEDELAGWHHNTGTWFGQTPGDGEGQGGLTCCSPWGHTELDTTRQLNNRNYKYAQNLSQCLLHDKYSINTTWVLHEKNLKHQWDMVGKYLSEQNKKKVKTLNCFTLSITNRNIGIFEFSDPKLSYFCAQVDCLSLFQRW